MCKCNNNQSLNEYTAEIWCAGIGILKRQVGESCITETYNPRDEHYMGLIGTSATDINEVIKLLIKTANELRKDDAQVRIKNICRV
jgi:hypothetical protein